MSYRVANFVDTEAELKRLQLQAEFIENLEEATFIRLGLPTSGVALDVGCGTGHFAARLLNARPNLTILGVDVDGPCLGAARELIPVVKADVRALPVRPGSLDFVYSRLCLRHVAHPEEALKAMVSALKPGGRLVIEEVDDGAYLFFPEPSLFKKVLALRHDAMLRAGADPNIGRKLLMLLRGAGLEQISLAPIAVSSLEVGRERFADVAMAGFAAQFHSEPISEQELQSLRNEISSWRKNEDAFGMTNVLVFGGIKTR